MNPNRKGNEKRFSNVEVKVQANLEELSRAAASEFLRQAGRAVQAKGLFSVALSGGSTPKSLYSLLANDSSFRAEIPWDKSHFFWGDERHVPPGHPEGNYRTTQEAMLSKVPIPSENIHRIGAENPNARGSPKNTRRRCEPFSA